MNTHGETLSIAGICKAIFVVYSYTYLNLISVVTSPVLTETKPFVNR